MAREVKVRGQTAKVPKQDKKKLPKGRALKRIKYNRRFVNVGEFALSLLNGTGAARERENSVLNISLVQWWALARRRVPTHSRMA